MDYLYLNLEQCHYFDTSYFEDATILVAASAILRSRQSGYDEEHKKFLSRQGGRILHLSRKCSDDPGWFKVLG